MDAINENAAKSRSGKRSKKRKFTGNIHTRNKQTVESLNESASGKKLHKCSSETLNTDNEFKGYSIVDINILFEKFQQCLCCKVCGGDITLNEEIVCGLSSKISIHCENCMQLCMFRNSKMFGANNTISDINRRFMYAFRANGMGLASMEHFCGIMELPKPVSEKSYNIMVKKLVDCSSAVSQKSMKNAAEEEKILTGSSDIFVSGDGTWKTRGHTSRIGVCTVIGDKTGKVLDTEVLSSYCKACDTWKDKKGTDSYIIFKESHEKDCLINHKGSAGNMEVVGMTRIFHRSEIKNSAMYVGYIGDGDAKTFSAVVQSSPYGPNKEIVKIECVGHIQKRMGTRLRKLKQNKVLCSDGKTLGGKGRLTDKLIDKLTSYYGNAIREHKNNLSNMRKAVWAVYFHTRSSDAEPLHSFCPVGPNSWCKYNKSLCEGDANDYKHKNPIPVSVMDAIKPVFNDLSQPKLLKRCLGGKTQNTNESLNSVIWKLCPKTQGCGRRIVEIATSEAAVLFNEGNAGRLNVMTEFGLTVGVRAKQFAEKIDKRRIAFAEMRLKQSTKEARQLNKMKWKAMHEKNILKEGTSYSAGEF